MDIRAVHGGEDLVAASELLSEYLEWATSSINDEFSLDFNSQEIIEEELEQLDIYFEQGGSILMILEDEIAAGIGFMKRIADDTAEIKRMYVRPEYRGHGFGRRILQELLDEARGQGYSKVRLDSANFMQAAHSMYRSEGFKEIAHYPESQVPSEYQDHWVFMEKHL